MLPIRCRNPRTSTEVLPVISAQWPRMLAIPTHAMAVNGNRRLENRAQSRQRHELLQTVRRTNSLELECQGFRRENEAALGQSRHERHRERSAKESESPSATSGSMSRREVRPPARSSLHSQDPMWFGKNVPIAEPHSGTSEYMVPATAHIESALVNSRERVT